MGLVSKAMNFLSGSEANLGAGEKPVAASGADRRKHKRHNANLVGSVGQGPGAKEINISDISCGGLRLSDFDELNVGEQIVVHVEELKPLKGKVVWARDGDTGVQFEEELDEDVSLPVEDDL